MEITVGQTYKPPLMESARFSEEFTKCFGKLDQMIILILDNLLLTATIEDTEGTH